MNRRSRLRSGWPSEIGGEDNDYALTSKAGAVLERVFGWTRDNVFGASNPNSLDASVALSTPRDSPGGPSARFG